VCNNFPWQFHFFLGAIHEKHNFKYFKNPTVEICKIWCNYVYMYILYCNIFWWKLIDRIFFNQIFNSRVVPQGIPPFFQFPLFARDYLQTGYLYMLDISYLLNNNTYTLKQMVWGKINLGLFYFHFSLCLVVSWDQRWHISFINYKHYYLICMRRRCWHQLILIQW
jgi:hypothetical protein